MPKQENDLQTAEVSDRARSPFGRAWAVLTLRDKANARVSRLADAVLLISVFTALGAFIPLVVAIFLLPDPYLLIFAMSGGVIITLLMVPAITVVSGDPRQAAWALCGITSLSLCILGLISGGISSAILPMLIAPVVWAWFLLGQRAGVIFLVMMLLTLALCAVYADEVNPDLPSIQSGMFGVIQSLTLTLTTIACSLAGYLANRNEKLIHEDIVNTRDRANRANREKSEMIAGIAHEIRTPLTGLMGMLELLAKEPLEPAHAEMADTAKASARNILDQINDLLDLSKIEVGELRLLPEPVDITALFEATAREFKATSEDKGLLFLTNAPEKPIWILIDPMRFRQILANFLSNALKFTERGHVYARLEIEDLDTGEVNLRVCVEDTGPGVPEQLFKAIFNRFTQVEGTQRAKHNGSGLGLAIVADLARLQGGKAWVEPGDETGSVFKFEASFKRTSALELPEKSDQSETNSGVRVLIADDSLGNQRVLTRVLQGMGYQTVSVANGSDAIVTIAREKIDLVLMDFHMPVKDGPTALKDIRRLPDKTRANTPVIGLSADSSESDMKRWIDAGVDGFVLKPVDFVALDLTMRRVLGVQRNSQSELSARTGS